MGTVRNKKHARPRRQAKGKDARVLQRGRRRWITGDGRGRGGWGEFCRESVDGASILIWWLTRADDCSITTRPFPTPCVQALLKLRAHMVRMTIDGERTFT